MRSAFRIDSQFIGIYLDLTRSLHIIGGTANRRESHKLGRGQNVAMRTRNVGMQCLPGSVTFGGDVYHDGLTVPAAA